MNPHDSTILNSLIESLLDSEYPANALAYKSIQGFTKEELSSLLVEYNKSDEILDAIRLVGEFYPQYLDLVKDFDFSDHHTKGQSRINELRSYFGLEKIKK